MPHQKMTETSQRKKNRFKQRPLDQIRLAKPFHTARKDTINYVKNAEFVDLLECNVSQNIGIT